jgi:two-component system autoinducer 1 sensor kinase/phosphatase LuxN
MAAIRALIVDDNVTSIRVIEQLLSMENVTSVKLTSTANLSETLDKIGRVDVIFLDLEMPNLNGYEAREVIKAHPSFRHTKVVAYSVHVSELNAVMDRAFDGFLGKPLSAEAFSGHLRDILAGEKVCYIP